MCSNFRVNVNSLAAALSTLCSFFSSYFGKPKRRALYESTLDVTKACIRISVVLNDRNFRIRAILRRWKKALLQTALICNDIDMVLSKMAPMFLATLDGAMASSPKDKNEKDGYLRNLEWKRSNSVLSLFNFNLLLDIQRSMSIKHCSILSLATDIPSRSPHLKVAYICESSAYR